MQQCQLKCGKKPDATAELNINVSEMGLKNALRICSSLGCDLSRGDLIQECLFESQLLCF